MSDWKDEAAIARAARRGVLPQAERLNLGGKKKIPRGDWLIVHFYREYLGHERTERGWVSIYSDAVLISVSRDFQTEEEARKFTERSARRWNGVLPEEWLGGRREALYCHRSVYERIKAALAPTPEPTA